MLLDQELDLIVRERQERYRHQAYLARRTSRLRFRIRPRPSSTTTGVDTYRSPGP
jgi:hypothetical protein